MHILLTRPEADARAMTQRLEAAGHRVTIEPLLQIIPATGVALPLAGAQGLVATSRNALRAMAGCDQLAEARRLPLVVVGPGTARTAKEMGFGPVIAGPGAAKDLLPLIQATFAPEQGALVILAGDVAAFDLASLLRETGFSVEKRVVYRSVASSDLSGTTAFAIRNGLIDAVVLMSPRTAQTYADVIRSSGLEAQSQGIVHCCISESTKAGLKDLQPVPCEVSVQPNLEEMLALIGRVAAKSTPRS